MTCTLAQCFFRTYSAYTPRRAAPPPPNLYPVRRRRSDNNGRGAIVSGQSTTSALWAYHFVSLCTGVFYWVSRHQIIAVSLQL